MTDSTAAVRARYDYDPYGKRTKLTGDLDCDFAFTGHFYHAGSNLHLALYRAYDQDIGRWLSIDPIREMGGMNLYGYVVNDPVNSLDLLGLDVFFNQQGGNAAHHWVKVGGKSPRGKCGKTYGLYPGPRGKWWGKDPATVESPDRYNSDDAPFYSTRYPTTESQERELDKWINDNYDVSHDWKQSSGDIENPAYNAGTSDCSKFSRRVRSKLFEIIDRDRGKNPFPKVKSEWEK